MAEVGFDKLYVATEPEFALDFARAWWGAVPDVEDYWVSLLMLPSAKSRFHRFSRLVEAIEDPDGLDPLVYPITDGYALGSGVARQDVYHGNALLGVRPQRGRGRVSDVGVAPGAWCDLDVKDGAFGRGSDIMRFCDDVLTPKGLRPSISIRTRGMDGGRHWYWTTDEPLGVDEMREASERMWLFVQTETGVKVDNLSDPIRIFRLPGTVRWSKNGNGERDGRGEPVTPDWITNRRVSLERIRQVTGGTWEAWKEGQARVRKERAAADREVMREWGSSAIRRIEQLRGMALAYALYEAREVYPKKTPWESILIPAGWTKYVPDHWETDADDQGHRMWTRPHAPDEKVNPRSAVTDWEDSPDVMSLLSDSPATGLSRLVDAGIPLSKVAVAAELHFGGSERAVLLDFIVREWKLA